MHIHTAASSQQPAGSLQQEGTDSLLTKLSEITLLSFKIETGAVFKEQPEEMCGEKTMMWGQNISLIHCDYLNRFVLSKRIISDKENKATSYPFKKSQYIVILNLLFPILSGGGLNNAPKLL